MSRLLSNDNLLKILAAILLTILTGNIRQVWIRLDRLEKGQQTIMVRLGIPPVADGIQEKSGIWAGLGGDPDNQRNQTAEKNHNFRNFPLDLSGRQTSIVETVERDACHVVG